MRMMQQMMAASSGQGGKKTRELYVGNLAIGMVSEQMVREFFNTAMAGLAPEAAQMPAVVNVWMASDMKYSFVEFRTPELANTAMSLDKVELCGRSIHVGRPSGYVPATEGGMAPGMAGMGAMGTFGMTGGTGSGMPFGAPATGLSEFTATATPVLILENMLSIEELASDEYDDIVSDIKEECGQYGTIEDVHIPKPSTDDTKVPGLGKAYIKYSTAEEAQKANNSLMGRTFDGKKVLCGYLSVEDFDAKKF
jgi:splicing factor U2AF subunit